MDSDGILGSIGTIATIAIGIGSCVLSFKKKREEAHKKSFDYDDELWDDNRNSPEAYVEVVSRREIPAGKTAPLNVEALHNESDSINDKTGCGKEKIDARKMIIYSEIMKPKFDDWLK